MRVLPDNVLRLMPHEERRKLGKAGMTTVEAAKAAEVRAEKDLQRMIAAALNRMGIVFNCSRMDRPTTGRVGWPDFVFALRDRSGRAVPCAVEAKAVCGRLAAEQRELITQMRANGWKVAVVKSYDEFVAFIREVQCN